MRRPTSVEPVKAILSISGWVTIISPTAPSPVTMLTTPVGSPASRQRSAKSSAVSEVYSAGFSTTVLPMAMRGRDLPRQHQQREVPRDDLAADAERLAVRAVRLSMQLRHAGVVVEMPRDQRDVDIAAFADRLAVVQRLQHREQARVLLHQPRQGIEVPRPARARPGLRPFRLRRAGGGDGGVDVRLRGLATRAPAPRRWPGSSRRKPSPGAVNAPSMKWPNRSPPSTSQASASAALSGAGP